MLSDDGGHGADLGAGLGLNAPFGARCFLTDQHSNNTQCYEYVLMHLLALGAF